MFLKPTESIDTPALLIDMEALERNMHTMNAFLEGRRIKLRPHFKTIKIPEIALMLLDGGAKGITCAKLGEAQALADAGVTDILLANQVVAPAKIERLAVLAGRVGHMAVAVETVRNVLDLDAACARAGTVLSVLVELDVGMNRCGVRSYDEGLAVARAIVDAPNLVFEGIQAYEGHLVLEPDPQARRDGVGRLFKSVGEFRDYLENHGIPVTEISGGGSGTYDLTGAGDVFTELQAGSFIYMDARYGKMGLPFEHALYVLGMVMSKRPGMAIVDVGLKCFSMENGPPSAVGFERSIIKLSEEHMTMEDCEDKLSVCDTVLFIPSHCCTTINIFDIAYGIRAGAVERVFEIKGRGKSQ